MLYSYSYKKATFDNPYPGHHIPTYLRLLPTLVSALGLLLIGTVAWPLINYQVSAFYKEKPVNFSFFPQLVSPVVSETALKNRPRSISLAPQTSSNNNIDYTKASNWFVSPVVSDSASPPDSTLEGYADLDSELSPTPTPQPINSFNLSIPSLGINNALVTVNGEDLSKSLIHFPGTALPGQYGNSVIFGHSTLPQLFNPTNYLTIFATLPTVKIGADIFVKIDQIKYTYRISRMYEVKPQDTWVLKQTYDTKTLKLITCVPPGTKLKRLVVEADLIKS
jgi:sortase A